MGWPRHHGLDDLDDALGSLPTDFVVRPIGRARFVLGPTGAEVVALDDGTDSAPRGIALLASVARSVLAEHATWVPYVDALLVTDRSGPCPPATAVPPARLMRTLVGGPPILTPTDLARLATCVRDGVLDGLTAVAPPLLPDQARTHH